MFYHIVGTSMLFMLGLEQFLSSRKKVRVTHSFFSEEETTAQLNSIDADIFWFEVDVVANGDAHKLRQVIRLCPKWKTVIFCNDKDPKTIQDFFRSGATAYLLPGCRVQTMEEAIGSIENKRIYIDPQICNDITDIFFGVKNTLVNRVKLTRREQEVLTLIIQEYTTNEIADKLFISFCTVETHRLHLIQKLGVKNTAGLVREAFLRQLC